MLKNSSQEPIGIMGFQLTSYIDIHTHILPGLDDGAKDIKESIALARLFQQSGITKVVATPHFLPATSWSATKEMVLESVQTVQTSLDNEGIELKILPGMEIGFHKKLAERILANSLLPLGESGYYLIEPSFHGEQDIFLEQLSSLLKQGKKMVVAHPERVDGFEKIDAFEGLAGLVGRGLLIQVNGGSLLGKFGKKSKSMAKELQKRNCIHFVASDAHDCNRRTPLDSTDWENLAAIEGGEALLAACNENVTKVFSSESEI
jgi:protein-tyrosine phosphatase